MKDVARSAVWSLMIGLALLLGASAASAQVATYTDLYNFGCQVDINTQTSTGTCNPNWPGILAQGTDGNLYGMACDGISGCNSASIFKMSPSGEITILYKFDGGTGAPSAGGTSGLTLGPDGNFYGITSYGGTGCGTIFQVSASGVVTNPPIHTFSGSDGCNPYAPPVVGDDGYLYGTAVNFGYKISTTGDFHVLTNSLPYCACFETPSSSPLLLASDGNFYGTVSTATSNGGLGAGTIYRMSPDGTVTILYNFFDPSGNYPQGELPYDGLVEGTDGNLYGTAEAGGLGGGTVFQMTKTGSLGWEYSFPPTQTGGYAPPEGADPFAGLIAATDGNFYGAAAYGGGGGEYGSYGTLFKIDIAGNLTVLYTFDAYWNNCGTSVYNCGIEPYSQPMQATSGLIYGLAGYGGVSNSQGSGVFYRLDAGLPAFVATIEPSGKVGDTIGILGQGFNNASSVSFNGTPASFTVVSDTYLTATVPTGATTGLLMVAEDGSTLSSNRNFRISGASGNPTTSTSLISSPSTSAYGQSVTFTATVTSQSGTPTGTVAFKDGDTTLGIGTLTAGEATFSTSELAAGQHFITAAYNGEGTYNSSASAPPLTQMVNQATTAVSVSNIPSNATFSGGFTATYSYVGDGTASVSSSTATACTASGNVVSFVGAGTCTLVAHATAGTNYAAATGNPQSFAIAQLQPTITISNIPPNRQYGGSFTPIYPYAGDGTTSVTSSTSTTCTVSGRLVSFIGLGTCTLTAHATATVNSAGATGSPQSFSIAQATPTISIRNIPVGAVYRGTFTPTYTYTGNGKTSAASGTTSTCTVSSKGLVSFVGAGVCSLTAHGTGTTNYAPATGSPQAFMIAQAITTISIKNIPGAAKKGGSFAPTYTYAGDGTPSAISNTPATCSVSSSTVKFVASGICTLTSQATAGTNYAASSGSPQSFTIK